MKSVKVKGIKTEEVDVEVPIEQIYKVIESGQVPLMIMARGINASFINECGMLDPEQKRSSTYINSDGDWVQSSHYFDSKTVVRPAEPHEKEYDQIISYLPYHSNCFMEQVERKKP